MFQALFEPVLAELDRLYWLLDVQSGPFSIADKPDFERLDTELDAHCLDVPEFANTSTSLWRPGVWSRFGSMLVEDEWTYLTGISGPEAVAVDTAKHLWRMRPGSPEHCAALDAAGGVLAVVLTSCWVVYTSRPGCLERLRRELWTESCSEDVGRWLDLDVE